MLISAYWSLFYIQNIYSDWFVFVRYIISEDMPTIKDEQLQQQFKNYHHRLTELKNSSSSLANGIISSLMGFIPIQLRGLSQFKFVLPKRKYFGDTVFMTFPGPTTEMHLLGKSVAEINFIFKGRVNTCNIYF